MYLSQWQRKLWDQIGARTKELMEEAVRENDPVRSPYLLERALALLRQQRRLYELFTSPHRVSSNTQSAILKDGLEIEL